MGLRWLFVIQESDEAGSDAEVSDEDEDADAKAERMGRRLAGTDPGAQPSTSGRQAAEARVRAAVSEGGGARAKRKGTRSEAGPTEPDEAGDSRVCITEGPVAVQSDEQVSRRRTRSASQQQPADVDGIGGEAALVASGVNGGSRDVFAAVARQQREQLLAAQPGAMPHHNSLSERNLVRISQLKPTCILFCLHRYEISSKRFVGSHMKVVQVPRRMKRQPRL